MSMKVKGIEGLSPVTEVRKVGRKPISDKHKYDRKTKKEKSFKELLEEKRKDQEE